MHSEDQESKLNSLSQEQPPKEHSEDPDSKPKSQQKVLSEDQESRLNWPPPEEPTKTKDEEEE